MKHLKVSLVIAALLLSGCASIFKGRTQKIKINTAPQGATVSLDKGGVICQATPCQILLNSKTPTTLLLEKAGHKPLEVEMKPEVSLFWVLSNFVTVIPLGLFVDLAGGAVFQHPLDPLRVRLTPHGESGEGVVYQPPDSEEYRRFVFIELLAGGFYDFELTGAETGIEAVLGVYVTPDIVLEASVDLTERYTDEAFAESFTPLGLGAKVFWTHGLYTSLGLMLRDKRLAFSASDGVSFTDLAAETVDLSFALGGQWQRGRYTINLEGLRAITTLAYLSVTELANQEEGETRDESALQSLFDELSPFDVRVMTLRLGTSF